MLMCVPSVGEAIARKLIEHFGSLEKLQAVLRGDDGFPVIQIGPKTTIGKARIAKLAKYLA